MLTVYIPSQCQPEVKYTFDCILGEFLDLPFRFEIHDEKDKFIIDVGQGQGKIYIDNNFFLKDDFESLYNLENIPSEIDFDNWEINEQSFPVVQLFGKDGLRKNEESWHIQSDLISACFFMLSRWEEYVIKDRDQHNRFKSSNALSVKYEFIDRPIVNEYVELLWALIQDCGYKGKRKKRSYQLVPTHDIDFPFKWDGLMSKVKSLSGKFLRGNFAGLKNEINYLTKREDLYDTYNLLMDKAENSNVKSFFFFMPGGEHHLDPAYNIKHPRVQEKIKHILSRGHEIGIHPSYDSYKDQMIFKQEKDLLEANADTKIRKGRQHFLRFEVPTTWQIWNDIGMEWDSTMTYADISGFRCGICYSYPVYNILTRTKLNLHERPLIAMDVTLMEHEKLSKSDILVKLSKLKEQVKKYNGDFVFLWHNSSFYEGIWLDETIMNELYIV